MISYVQDLKIRYSTANDDSQPVQKCISCKTRDKQTTSEYKCMNCDIYLCKNCREEHLKFKATKDHVTAPTFGTEFVQVCSFHDHPVKYYCEKCKENLCNYCLLTAKHVKHSDKVLSYMMIQETVNKVGDLNEDIDKKVLELKEKLQMIEKCKLDMSEIAEKIVSHTNKLTAQIVNEKNAMLSKLDTEFLHPVEIKVNEVSEYITELSNMKNSVPVTCGDPTILPKLSAWIQETGQILKRVAETSENDCKIPEFQPAKHKICLGELLVNQEDDQDKDDVEIPTEQIRRRYRRCKEAFKGETGYCHNITGLVSVTALPEGEAMVLDSISNEALWLSDDLTVKKRYSFNKENTKIKSIDVWNNSLVLLAENGLILKYIMDSINSTLPQEFRVQEPNEGSSSAFSRISAVGESLFLVVGKDIVWKTHFVAAFSPTKRGRKTKILTIDPEPSEREIFTNIFTKKTSDDYFCVICDNIGAGTVKVINQNGHVVTASDLWNNRRTEKVKQPKAAVITEEKTLIISHVNGLFEYTMEGGTLRKLFLDAVGVQSPVDLGFNVPYLWLLESGHIQRFAIYQCSVETRKTAGK